MFNTNVKMNVRRVAFVRLKLQSDQITLYNNCIVFAVLSYDHAFIIKLIEQRCYLCDSDAICVVLAVNSAGIHVKLSSPCQYSKSIIQTSSLTFNEYHMIHNCLQLM